MVAVCFPANEKIGPGDRFIVNELAKVRRTTKIAVATKTDLVDAASGSAQHLLDIAALGAETEHRVGRDRAGLGRVRRPGRSCSPTCWSARLPEGPPLYPDGELTDAPEEIDRRRADPRGRARGRPRRAAALDRGAWSRRWGCARTGPTTSRCSTSTPTSTSSGRSQKGIVIGHQGARLREVGTAARQQIEALLGTPVYLDLHVKIAKDWQRDPKQLRKLGF